MYENELTYLLHLRVYLSFLQIIRGFDCPGKYISQPTRIIGSLLSYKYDERKYDICNRSLVQSRKANNVIIQGTNKENYFCTCLSNYVCE
jgi:hypothetical protein